MKIGRPTILLGLLLASLLSACERHEDWQQAEDGLIAEVGAPAGWESLGTRTQGATGMGNPYHAYRLPDGADADPDALDVPEGYERLPADFEAPDFFGGWLMDGLPDIPFDRVAAWRGTSSSRPCLVGLWAATTRPDRSWAVVLASCQESA